MLISTKSVQYIVNSRQKLPTSLLKSCVSYEFARDAGTGVHYGALPP